MFSVAAGCFVEGDILIVSEGGQWTLLECEAVQANGPFDIVADVIGCCRGDGDRAGKGEDGGSDHCAQQETHSVRTTPKQGMAFYFNYKCLIFIS